MNDGSSALARQQLNQSASELGTFWHRVRSRVVTDVMNRLGATCVADVGAGAGHFGGWLREHASGIEYRYLEPLDDVRAQLVRQFGREGQIDDLASIGEVDAVTMLDVLEHIEDDVDFLIDLHAAMPPGSHLVLTVPANQALFSYWDERLGHFRRYSKTSLEESLNRGGFVVEQMRFLFPELQIPAAARRIRPPKDGADEAEFPQVPVFVDRLAYAVSSTLTRLGRATPGGTSLLACARRT